MKLKLFMLCLAWLTDHLCLHRVCSCSCPPPSSFTHCPLSLTPLLQETVTVDLYIIRKLGLVLRNFPQV